MKRCIELQLIALIISLNIFTSCEKLIEIPPSINTITNDEASQDSLTMSGTITGLYSALSNRTSGLFCSGLLNVSTGLYSDELLSNDQSFLPYTLANITPIEVNLREYMWGHLYAMIYHSNLIIDNATISNNLTPTAKKQFIGESKFIRAYCYFYLINLFGDVPIVLTPNYTNNIHVPRDAVPRVYEQIIQDLTQSKSLLKANYDISNGERIRATSYAAAALLAKVYLFQNKYTEAISESNYILNVTNQFRLEDDPTNAFNIGSTEAILQFACNPAFFPYNATGDGWRFIFSEYDPPQHYFQSNFINSIDREDQRWKWIDSMDYLGVRYYTPLKYTVGGPLIIPNGPTPQYTTAFRVAEQILIRAECNIKLGNISAGVDDLNTIRYRAKLKQLTTSDAETAMVYIENERRIELFCEQGNRWLDLKRWGKADAINSGLKPDWKSYKLLFPIPKNELQTNSKMIQNPGYF